MEGSHRRRRAVRRTCAGAVLTAVLTVVVSVSASGAAAGKGPYEFSGSGSTRTTGFQLPDHWTLKWSFDCSQSISGPGVFSVQVVEVGSSAPELNLRIPRLLRFDTAGSGVQQYDEGGHRAFLRIAVAMLLDGQGRAVRVMMRSPRFEFPSMPPASSGNCAPGSKVPRW